MMREMNEKWSLRNRPRIRIYVRTKKTKKWICINKPIKSIKAKGKENNDDNIKP